MRLVPALLPPSVAALVALLAATLRSPADEGPPADSAPPAGGDGPPAMVWKVTGGKADLYLAGSIHVFKPSDYPLPSPFEDAYAASDAVIMEIKPGELADPAVRAEMLRAAMIDDGSRLQDKLSPDSWNNLRQWCRDNAVAPSSLERMQPWMASLTIAMNAFEKLGYTREGGIEAHFADRLADDGKSAAGFESAGFQIRLFSGLSPAQQEQMVARSLEEVKDAGSRVDKIFAAWRSGDADALHKVLRGSFADFPELEKRLLLDRNRAWIAPIEQALNGSATSFVLVGAGHLVGPGSVVDLLRRKGYRLEQLRAKTPAAAPAPTAPDTPAAPPAKKAA